MHAACDRWDLISMCKNCRFAFQDKINIGLPPSMQIWKGFRFISNYEKSFAAIVHIHFGYLSMLSACYEIKINAVLFSIILSLTVFWERYWRKEIYCEFSSKTLSIRYALKANKANSLHFCAKIFFMHMYMNRPMKRREKKFEPKPSPPWAATAIIIMLL